MYIGEEQDRWHREMLSVFVFFSSSKRFKDKHHIVNTSKGSGNFFKWRIRWERWTHLRFTCYFWPIGRARIASAEVIWLTKVLKANVVGASDNYTGFPIGRHTWTPSITVCQQASSCSSSWRYSCLLMRKENTYDFIVNVQDGLSAVSISGMLSKFFI